MEPTAEQMKQLMAREQQLMTEHGWIVHYVFDTAENPEYEGYANIHTHGIAENFGHMDVQIVIPIPPETAQIILHHLVEEIKEGKVFEANERYDHILQNMDVSFAVCTEKDRDVLRLLLPDENGNLPTDAACDSFYKRQLTLTFQD